MAVTPRGSATFGSNTGTQQTAMVVAIPTGVVAGDLLIAYLAGDNDSSVADFTAPAGWTVSGAGTATGMRSQLYYLVAGSSEPSQYSFGSTSYNTASCMVTLIALSGVDVNTPINTAASMALDSTGTSGSAVAPSITPAAGVGAIVCGFSTQGQSSNTAMSTPAGMTSLGQRRSPADNWAGELVAWEPYTTTTATGTATSTYAVSNVWAAFSLAVNLAGVGGTVANVAAAPTAQTVTIPDGMVKAAASPTAGAIAFTSETPAGGFTGDQPASVTASPSTATATAPVGVVWGGGYAGILGPVATATVTAPMGRAVGEFVRIPPAPLQPEPVERPKLIHRRLFLADGVTGQIVGDLPYTGVPSWSRQLNDNGSLSATVPLFPPLDETTKQRLNEPWRWILAYAEGGTIRQAGYLVSGGADDKPDAAAALGTKSVWEFLGAKRLVMNPGVDISTSAADVVFSTDSPDLANRKLSLQGIARRLVEIASTGDLAFPILLPDPISGDSIRSYAAADEATVGARLTELTQVIDGPEVEFSPEFTDDSQSHMQWRMRIGNTRLGQLGFPHNWDHGSALITLSVTMDGADMTFRCIAKGQDTRQAADGTTPASGVLTWAQSSIVTPYPSGGWPMLVTADTTHSDVTIQDTIQGYADAAVQSGQLPVSTASAVIRNDGRDNLNRHTGSPSVDLISVGDTGIITVKSHPWLPAGDYSIRILDIGSGPDAYSSSLTLQMF